MNFRAAGSDWPAWVAGRYLRTTRQDSFVRFLSWTAGLGVGLGVAALILALSAMTGLQDAIRRSAAEGADLVRVRVNNSELVPQIQARLEPLVGRERLSTVVEGDGWLVAAGQVRPIKVVAFSGRRPVDIGAGGTGGRPPAAGDVYLAGLGLPVDEDQVVELATARPRVGPLGSEPTVVRVRVRSVRDGEPTAWLPLAAGQRLLGTRRVEVAVAPGGAPEPDLFERVESVLMTIPGTTVRGWQDLEPGLWLALRLEKVLVFVAVFLIVLVAALALVADLYLLIADRRREVGILQALGAQDHAIRRSFQRFGVSIAAAGSLAGVIVGVLLSWLLDRTGWVTLPGDGYLLDHVPFTIRLLDVGVIGVSSWLLAWAVCRLATGGATARNPVEALRR